jgi:hypothetical protein
MTAPARSTVRRTTHRLIASRFPPVGVFDDLDLGKDELAMAYLLESVTNDRLALVSRRLELLPESEIVQGAGATLVMAAFLHADEQGGRFTDGRLGAWYASFDVSTAIAETSYHSARRLKLSDAAFPSRIQMRELLGRIDCALVDIRGKRRSRPGLYDPDNLTEARAFGVGLRWPRSGKAENGIVYDSVRRRGGTNVCIYRPPLIALPVVQADHYEYRWDRLGALTVMKLSAVATP